MSSNPSGLPQSLATLAMSLFEAMPMLAVSWRSERMRALSSRAHPTADTKASSGSEAGFRPEASRYASSTDTCSTSTPLAPTKPKIARDSSR